MARKLANKNKILRGKYMRDVNRLYGFYNELMKIHIENFPDWRFGQLINNLERWLQVNNKIPWCDIFYIEEDEMLHCINEFVKDIKTN